MLSFFKNQYVLQEIFLIGKILILKQTLQFLNKDGQNVKNEENKFNFNSSSFVLKKFKDQFEMN